MHLQESAEASDDQDEDTVAACRRVDLSDDDGTGSLPGTRQIDPSGGGERRVSAARDRELNRS